MKQEFDYTIYADGGARGNPGPAAYGFVIYEKGSKVFEEGKTLGIQTNNYAEYSAVIAALKYVSQLSSLNSHLSIQFFLDSQLVTEQLSGRWKVKNENIRNLFHTVKILEQKIGGRTIYKHILREQNKEADRMVNLALDGEIQQLTN